METKMDAKLTEGPDGALRGKARQNRSPRLGAKIRRLRRQRAWSQAGCAQRLRISASYLNLIEHNRRNVTVPLLLQLAELFELDLSSLAEEDEGRLAADLMEVFGDALFSEHELMTTDVRDLVSANPPVGRAVVSLYDAYRNACQDVRTLAERRAADDEGDLVGLDSGLQPADQVSDFIQQNGNYFGALEGAAERVRAEARIGPGEPFAGLVDYLAAAHGVRVAVLPPAPGRNVVRHFDPATRGLEISELLPAPSRNFQLVHQIGLLAAGAELDAELEEGEFSGEARALARVALANYFAAALLMPYEPFLTSARTLRYDLELLEHHFGASFEQVCHRLTTLQRPGARGVPFHMLRTDIAGNISKRFSLSGIHIPRHGGACPRWNVYTAFMQPGVIHTQLSRMPDGASYFCIARTLHKRGGGYGAPQSYLSIGLGCEVGYAKELVYADGKDLHNPEIAVPIGVACRICERMDCRQRAFPPISHRLNINENMRGLSAYVSAR